MRTLLCTLNAKYIHTNLAVRILYEQNYQNHPGLEWREFTIKENRDELADICSQYHLVAFSCYIWNITQTLELSAKIKVLNPAIKVLLGGPEVSYDFDDVIAKQEIDYIIAGEGETAFSVFLNHFPDVGGTPNLVWKKEGKILSNAHAPVFDLKEFENNMPYRFDDSTELSKKVAYLETSRGCPYKCEFCLASLDNKVRYLPNTQIKNTLAFLMKHGKVIKFLDRTFNIKRDFTLDIFRFILDHRRPGNVFQFEITADILHPDIIKFIHTEVPQGIFRFEIGIQTVNQQANLAVQRKQSFEKTKKIIQELSYKIEMHLDLIIGLPLDQWDDIKYSIEQVFNLFAPEMQLGFLKFLKGTPMRNKEEHGYIFDPNPPYQIIESKYLSSNELKKLTLLEEALEIYWNGKKAVNTLKYVATRFGVFDFLLKLGQYFVTRKDFHQHSLDNVYEILSDFCKINFPGEIVLQQLIAVDYYQHFKLRPKLLFGGESFSKSNLTGIKGPDDIAGHRFVKLPLNFNYEIFISENRIVEQNFVFLIRYNGRSKGQVLTAAELSF
jgi:anaerobic magnesium-protoporphyrin IX monomethyl ester cyclase